jgi:hypothetical protein
MKMDLLQPFRLVGGTSLSLQLGNRGGRKKDFWDLHELMEHFSLSEMVGFYEKRYPYSSSREEVISKITSFDAANDDLLT